MKSKSKKPKKTIPVLCDVELPEKMKVTIYPNRGFGYGKEIHNMTFDELKDFLSARLIKALMVGKFDSEMWNVVHMCQDYGQHVYHQRILKDNGVDLDKS